jgi:hypothetical protein
MNQFARALGVALVGGVLAAGCGGGDDESASSAETRTSKQEEGGDQKPTPETTATVKTADPADPKMATAVADAKTTAPVDLQYDLPVKPQIGQPFVVELVLKPRLPADSLDVEIGDSPGITIEGERMSRFLNVEGGQLYKFAVTARGDAVGLYYIAVIAKLATKVQSEGRAFSVPVVIGDPPAAQKPAPQKDASGQAIQSMPAKEN